MTLLDECVASWWCCVVEWLPFSVHCQHLSLIWSYAHLTLGMDKTAPSDPPFRVVIRLRSLKDQMIDLAANYTNNIVSQSVGVAIRTLPHLV